MKITIERFDPTKDAAPYEVSYDVPWHEYIIPLEALMYVHENCDAIAFDYTCRGGLCGRCTMTVDGEPAFGCIGFLDDSDHTIAPLRGFPVMQDLVVDKRTAQADLAAAYRRVRAFPLKREEIAAPNDGFTAHEREDMLEKARSLVDNPSSWKGRSRKGAGKYVKSTAVVPSTGEAARDVLELDLAKAEADAALDGYYLVVTSETSMTDGEVVEAYRGLWRIEESFRTLKGCMSARPVFVRTPEHIRAHFLVCFIALTAVRLMQADTGWSVPSGRVSGELSKLEAVHVAENYYQVQHRSEATDALCAAAGLDLTRRYVTKSDVKDLAARARKGNRA